MNTLSQTDFLAGVVIVLIILLTFLASILSKRKNHKSLQTPQAFTGIDTLMHRSSEEGKTLIIGLGEGFSGLSTGLGDTTGLLVERTLMNRVVFNDKPTHAFSSDGALASISRMVVFGAYENAMATELFRPEYNQLSGPSPFAGMAGLLPELARPGNAGLVMAGAFRPESILIADLAERKRVPLIFTSGSVASQAAFFATEAEITLGEDYYLPAVGKSNRGYVQGTAMTLNWLRVIIAIALLVAAVLKLSGVLP
jgi:hypothetical protein